jgi:hypothetical protein
MADILKCTKIALGLTPSLSSGDVGVLVEWVDPTTSPPTPGSGTGSMPLADALDPSNIRGECGSIANAAVGNSIDWTL